MNKFQEQRTKKLAESSFSDLKMQNQASQADYELEKRPIVLGILHTGAAQRAELLPTMLFPGPRIVQVEDKGDEVEAHELAVPNDPTDEQREYCGLIQFTIYWIAERSRLVEEEGSCLNYQRAFLRDAKDHWDDWMGGALTADEFGDCVVQLVESVEGRSDIMGAYGLWKELPERVETANAKWRAHVLTQMELGYTSTLPSEAARREVECTMNYAMGAVAVLAGVTECAEVAQHIERKFADNVRALYDDFQRGHVSRRRWNRLLEMMFKGSCIAASSTAIVEEAEKEIAIVDAEKSLEGCATAPAVLTNMPERCPICLCDIYVVESSATPCGHLFHTTCIRRSLLEKKACPICRSEIQ